MKTQTSLCIHARLVRSFTHIWAAPCQNMSYADSKSQTQPAHSGSLIRVFTLSKQNHWILQNVSMMNKCLGEALCMCRMTKILKFCSWPKALFHLTQPILFKLHKQTLKLILRIAKVLTRLQDIQPLLFICDISLIL